MSILSDAYNPHTILCPSKAWFLKYIINKHTRLFHCSVASRVPFNHESHTGGAPRRPGYLPLSSSFSYCKYGVFSSLVTAQEVLSKCNVKKKLEEAGGRDPAGHLQLFYLFHFISHCFHPILAPFLRRGPTYKRAGEGNGYIRRNVKNKKHVVPYPDKCTHQK